MSVTGTGQNAGRPRGMNETFELSELNHDLWSLVLALLVRMKRAEQKLEPEVEEI